MDWFLYDRDLRHERVKLENFFFQDPRKINLFHDVYRYLEKEIVPEDKWNEEF